MLPSDLDERAEVLSRENGKIRFEADDRPARSSEGASTRQPKYARELDTAGD